MRQLTKHHLLFSFALLFLVALLTLPAIYNLFHPGFFATHDGEWMIIRFSAFYDALRDGQFPVRWLGRLNNLYGYPAPNFAYPLFMYLAVPIHAVGFGLVNSIKILTMGTFVASAICTYLWLRKLFTVNASVVGSIVYTYTPYHIFNLYTRGSIGELVALSILPFIFWQIERRSSFFIGIGIGLLMLSHNILAFLFLPLVVIYIFFRFGYPFNFADILQMAIPVALGVGLSAFFIIPAIYDLQYIIFEEAKLAVVATNFVGVELFGVISLLLLVAATVLAFKQLKDTGKRNLTSINFRLLICFLVVGWATWFLTNSISTIVWKILPSTILQYPFRLLSLLPIVVAFVAAYLLSSLKKYQLIAGAVIGIGTIATAIPYLTPSEFFDRGDMYYANNFATTNLSNEYTPRWVEKQIFSIPDAKVKSNSGTIENLTYKSNYTEFILATTQSAKVKINTTYFPGWEVMVDGNKVPVAYKNTYGVMTFTIPEGTHKVIAQFGETPVRLASDVVSCLSLIGLFVWAIYRREFLLQRRKR